jgi:hypothetical protein
MCQVLIFVAPGIGKKNLGWGDCHLFVFRRAAPGGAAGGYLLPVRRWGPATGPLDADLNGPERQPHRPLRIGSIVGPIVGRRPFHLLDISTNRLGLRGG